MRWFLVGAIQEEGAPARETCQGSRPCTYLAVMHSQPVETGSVFIYYVFV